MALKLKLANGKEALKEYSENVLLGDYSDYRKSLKALQLSVNETLSALVVNESGKNPTCGVYCLFENNECFRAFGEDTFSFWFRRFRFGRGLIQTSFEQGQRAHKKVKEHELLVLYYKGSWLHHYFL